ncbi:hypothetical protein GCM10020366_72000 [Saccharopolyspora gregorii]|uniref:Uncharacterized protein n=1 Tax=Saccharopolyspora gregorii TaxID=33914 RepID=A0ABP6S3M4_9PSEU
MKCVSAEVIGGGEVHRRSSSAVEPFIAYRLPPAFDAFNLVIGSNRARRGTRTAVDGMTESDPRGGVEVTANAAVPEQAGSAAGSPDRRRWWRVLCRDVGHIRRYLTVLVNRTGWFSCRTARPHRGAVDRWSRRVEQRTTAGR